MAAFTPTGVEFIARGINPYLKNLGKANKAQQGLGKSVVSLGNSFSGVGKSVLKFGAIAGGVALAGVGALGVATIALGKSSVETAISFESAFAGVIKTTDGLTDSVGKLNIIGKELKQGFVDLSKEVPLAFEELARIGELGGQLGIGREALLQFTETVAGLGVATNLSTEEAATGLARVSNIFNIASEEMGDNIEQLGSTIVDLGNNFATTESEILNMGLRLAGAGKVAGLTQADILGISTALSSVGIQAEVGGTAVQKVLLEIDKAVNSTATGFVDYTDKIEKNTKKMLKLNATSARLEAQFPGLQAEILAQREAFIEAGGAAEEFGRQLGDKARQKAFETASALQELRSETELLKSQHGQPVDSKLLATFAKTAGKASGEFVELWEKDASEAFELFVTGLGESGKDAVNILEELGLEDQRLRRVFLSLAGAGEILGKTIDTASEAWEENTALAIEAQRRYETTESQLVILKNTFRAIGNTIGSRFLPFLNRLVTAGKDLINKFAVPIEKALDEKVVPAIESIIALGAKLFATFQAGGTAGLVSALGLTPATTELIDKIVQSITDLGLTVAGVLFPALNQITTSGILEGINTAIEFLNENFEAFKGAIIGVGAVLASSVIVAVLGGIVAAIGAVLSPIGLLIAAAALLGAAWAQNWFGIREITAQVIEVIQQIIEALVQTFTTFVLPQLQTAFDNLTQALNALGLDWSDVWNAVIEAIKIVGIAIGVVIGLIIVTITGLVTGIATALAVATSFFEEFGAAFTRIIEGLATTFAGWVVLIEGIMAGDWSQIWEGAKLIVEGAIQQILGLFDLLLTSIEALAKTALGFFAGFAQGVIDVFTSLSDTLIGNSIIPDMVQGIIDTFTGMIEPIVNVFSGLVSTIGGIFASIFGGGEGFTLDLSAFTDTLPAALAANTEAFGVLTQAIELVNLQISVTLVEAINIFLEVFTASFAQVIVILEQVIFLLTNIATNWLPAVQIASQQTAAIMVNGFANVNSILIQTIKLLQQIISSLVAVAENAKKAVDEMENFEDAHEPLEKLIKLVKKATEAFNKMAEAAAKAASAASDAGTTSEVQSGVGFAKGIGFQAGLGLGTRIPGQGRGDVFGPLFLEPGEEILVTPRGQSIEGLIFDRLSQLSGSRDRTNNFSMTVNTLAQPQSVIQQFEVMRALIG